MTNQPPKDSIALAHDYLTQRGGAERVLLSLARAFPEAPIYTTLYNSQTTYPEFSDHDIRVSPINKINYFRRNHRAALPILPLATRAIRINAEIVLASSTGWAHGVKTTGRKVIYCHSPARWLYQQDRYLGAKSQFHERLAAKALRKPLVNWDKRSAYSSDMYIANSSIVRDRIQDIYELDADLVFPPVSPFAGKKSIPDNLAFRRNDFFLCVSRLLPYKNVDAVIDAFNLDGSNLVIVGDGPEYSNLARRCRHNVQMLRHVSDAELAWLYAECKALVAASYEDFGLTPLEAASAGKPVAALRWGGYLDTVQEGVTGVFFEKVDPHLIREAIQTVKSTDLSLIHI